MRIAHNQYYVSERIALQIGFITYKYTLILHKYTAPAQSSRTRYTPFVSHTKRSSSK